MSVLATDTFTGANGSGLGANWTTTTGLSAPVIEANAASDSGGGNFGSRYSGVAAPNDAYAQVVVTKLIANTDQGPGPAIRVASGATTMYFAQCNTTEIKLYKVVAGAFTQLGADAAAAAVNDVIYIEAVGTTITVKKNGTTIISQTDAAIASGSGGIWLGGLSAQDIALDNFELGDFSGSAVQVPYQPQYGRAPVVAQ